MTMAEKQEGKFKAAVRELPAEAISVFTERDLRLIENCKSYAALDPAGMSGQDLLLIIDKLDVLVGQLIDGRWEAEVIEILDR